MNAASFAPTEGRIKEAKAAIASLMSYVESLEAPTRKVSRKPRKQKSGKATAATKVADKQEKAFHGRPDTPVTPSAGKPKASVEAARASLSEMDEKRAVKKAKALAVKRVAKGIKPIDEAVAPPVTSPVTPPVTPPVTSSEDRIASLEAKIEALLALQAMGHDVTRSAEVLFSDLPFEPTITDTDYEW